MKLLQQIKRWWKKAFDKETKPDHDLLLETRHATRVPSILQIRFVFHIFSDQERTAVASAIAVALATLIALIGLAISPHIERAPAPGGTLTEGLIGTPRFINPVYASKNAEDTDLTTLIFSGLFRIDDTLRATPDLAESYQWIDAQTLEIHLRKDVRFHDGEPLSSDDVVFTYQAIQNPAWKSPLAKTFSGIEVTRMDESTIRFHLPESNPGFLKDLTVGILPAHLWTDVDEDHAILADANLRPIGSGPYRFVKFTRDSKGTVLSYELQAFEGYHGLKPHIQTWIFRFFADREQALTALKGNQIDALGFISWRDAEKVKNDRLRTVPMELPQETVAFFNTKDAILKNERVREALARATDREELVRLVGHSVAVNSPYPLTESTSTVSSDIDGARALLDKAGWRMINATDTVRVLVDLSTKKPVRSATASSTELSVLIEVPNQPDLIKVAETLKRQWSFVGVKVDLRVEELKPLVKRIMTDRVYQVLLWNVVLPPDQDVRPFWTSHTDGTKDYNFSNFVDRTIESALDGVANATSTETMLTAQTKVANAINAHAPALFLLRPQYAYLISSAIRGVESLKLSTPSNRLEQASAWYINTTLRWR